MQSAVKAAPETERENGRFIKKRKQRSAIDTSISPYTRGHFIHYKHGLGSGHHLHADSKALVANLYISLKCGQISLNHNHPSVAAATADKKGQMDYRQAVAFLLCLSVCTVATVWAEHNRDPDVEYTLSKQGLVGVPFHSRFSEPAVRGQKKLTEKQLVAKADPDIVAYVRTGVEDFNRKYKPCSVPALQKWIRVNHSVCSSRSQIRRILRICGYVFGCAAHHHVNKESDANMLYRARYLRRKRDSRKARMHADGYYVPELTEIYLDESYCNLHHTRRQTWYMRGTSVPRRSGVGKRVNILGAIAYRPLADGSVHAEIVPDRADGQSACKTKRVLKIWDGTKERKTTTTIKLEDGQTKEVAVEPLDYHGNVDAEMFEVSGGGGRACCCLPGAQCLLIRWTGGTCRIGSRTCVRFAKSATEIAESIWMGHHLTAGRPRWTSSRPPTGE
jgi:hypothetical protein